MPIINGTFLKLHETEGRFPPMYHNTLEFGKTISLGKFLQGSSERTETYKFKDNYDNDAFGKLINEAVSHDNLFFVESNSAHHLSCYLANGTFGVTKETEKEKVPGALVVNFDQHEDHGSPESDLLCGNWGGHVNCDYLVVGLSKGNEARLYVRDEHDKKKYKHTKYSLDNYHTVFGTYNKIYVTVDMDVLNGGESGRTNWRHGAMPKDILLRLLKGLPGDKLVAADITGFPPYIKDEDKRNERIDELNSYIQDITETANALCGLMKKPLYILRSKK